MKFQILALAALMVAAPAFAQDAAAAPAGPPVCGGKVQDGCVQSRTEKNAMTGEQADKRDARAGGWAPDKAAALKASKKAAAPKVVTTTTVTTTTEAAPK